MCYRISRRRNRGDNDGSILFVPYRERDIKSHEKTSRPPVVFGRVLWMSVKMNRRLVLAKSSRDLVDSDGEHPSDPLT